MDNVKLDEIGIEYLDLSVRSYNALKRAGVESIQDLLNAYDEDAISNYPCIGAKSLDEINLAVEKARQEGFDFERILNNYGEDGEGDNGYVVPEELENISIAELKLSTRLRTRLEELGYDTVGKILRINEFELRSIQGIGLKTIQELKTMANRIKEEGADFFIEPSPQDMPVDEKYKRSIDTELVKKLKNEYGFKSSWLCEWYDVTRSRIQQIMTKPRNRGNWLNREFTSENREILLGMIKDRSWISGVVDGTKGYIVSNKKDDCAVIFENDEEIKCFFLDMLPVDIQDEMRKERYDCLSMDEFNIISSGTFVSVLKQGYFCPASTTKFRNAAILRDMSLEEYAVFLTGNKYVASTTSMINDEKIKEFLLEHYINGRLMIPSNTSSSWFRSFISRNGYSVEEIAELYGLNELNNSKQAMDEEDKYGDVEDDMMPYTAQSDTWIDKVFAENPLIGNKIISEKTVEKLYKLTKGYIDKRLNNPGLKLPLAAKKQIALAVITYAKEWDSWDESAFWKYITSQFGYRDETNQLRGLLSECIVDAVEKSGRWFISNHSGYQYKSTVVTHALSTKRSWMLLYDFLFDFYKTNMEWNYIEDDPIVHRMVIALRTKLIAGDEADNDCLEISNKVYSFQEGIRKLIIYRTGYAIRLINHMLCRLDSVINHLEEPPKLYVDILCDQWIEDKLRGASEAKNRRQSESSSRNVAIDYTRIRPVYKLFDETKVVLSIPDIRLKHTDFEKVTLKVYIGDDAIDTRSLSFYGNELGKTLNSIDIDMDMCLRRGDGSLHIRVCIDCDGEIIYDSISELFREVLCFSRGNEVDVHKCEKGSYSLFAPCGKTLEFEGAETSVIDADDRWNALFVRLKEDFVVKMDGQIVSLDDNQDKDSGGFRVMYPSVNSEMTFLKNGRKYSVITKNSDILVLIKNEEDIRKGAVLMNSKRVDLSSVEVEKTETGTIFHIPISESEDGICEFQLVDLERNRIVSQKALRVFPNLSVRFDRAFYCSDDDFADAHAEIIYRERVERLVINKSDDVLSFPVESGVVEIKVPRVSVRNTKGEKWPAGYLAWIGSISQDEKLYISYPSLCSVRLKVGNVNVSEDEKGTFDYGNAVFAYSDDGSDWIDIVLFAVSGELSQKNVIGRISPREQFRTSVQFDYHDDSLYWNRGMGFVGNLDNALTLRLFKDEVIEEYPLDLESSVVVENPGLSPDEYAYQIVKASENIFLGDETVIDEGYLFIGDRNEIRFRDKMIAIQSITYEEDDSIKSVEITGTYIDKIEYQGIHFVDSEDRECPVYTGAMFYMGQSMKHHYFAYNEGVSERGHELYKVNPVKIVFINEHTISITNEEDDGIYYYRFFDKFAMENRYSITDREPVDKYKHAYYLADLYTYTKEEVK